MFQQPSHADRQRQRENRNAEIIDKVRRIVREEMSDSPSIPTGDAEMIETEIVNYTSLIVDALSTEEMQSEGALVNHIANTRCDIQRLIRNRRPRTAGPEDD